MIHLVLPMAGMGSRFTSAGYGVPKPLLRVGPYRMFEIVLANFWSPLISRVTLVTRGDITNSLNLQRLKSALGVEIGVLALDELTDGPATTVKMALELDKPTDEIPLLVANTDQYLDIDSQNLFQDALHEKCHLILGMRASGPKWSYVTLDDETKRVSQVREKVEISNKATCGIYLFRSSADFLRGYESMKSAGDYTNHELYVAPIFNYLLPQPVDYLDLGSEDDIFHGLGVPEDYERFLKSSALVKAVAKARGVLG